MLFNNNKFIIKAPNNKTIISGAGLLNYDDYNDEEDEDDVDDEEDEDDNDDDFYGSDFQNPIMEIDDIELLKLNSESMTFDKCGNNPTLQVNANDF